jgi:hypothetical protein
MTVGWRVVLIILKNVLLFFEFIVILNLSSVGVSRPGGSLGPTSECRRVPQPRWVEREGEREGGKERGGRRPA